MIRLVRAEFLKLRTTQTWFWLLVVAVAVTVLFVVAQLAPHDGVRTYSDAVNALTVPATSYVVVFVLGVLGVTTEFRYQTITPTVLVTPSRWTLITAKLVAYAIVGALYALVCVLVEMAVALPWLSSKHIDVSVTGPHIPRALAGVFAVVALFGIVGLGVGALLRNQIVAVSVGVIFLVVINNLLLAIPGVRAVYPYSPTGALASIVQVTGSRRMGPVSLVPAPAGIVILLLWAFVPALVGAALTMNRDIT